MTHTRTLASLKKDIADLMADAEKRQKVIAAKRAGIEKSESLLKAKMAEVALLRQERESLEAKKAQVGEFDKNSSLVVYSRIGADGTETSFAAENDTPL